MARPRVRHQGLTSEGRVGRRRRLCRPPSRSQDNVLAKNQILKELIDTAEPGSRAHEQQKTGILLRCTEDLERAPRSLEKSMNNSVNRSEEHTSELQSLRHLVCRLLL